MLSKLLFLCLKNKLTAVVNSLKQGVKQEDNQANRVNSAVDEQKAIVFVVKK